MISDHLGLEVTWLGGQIVKLTSKLNSAASNCVDLIPILKKLISDHFGLEVTWLGGYIVKSSSKLDSAASNCVDLIPILKKLISDHFGLEVTWLGGYIVKLTTKLNSAASNCVDLIPILKKLIGDHFDLEVTWPRALEVKTEVRFELCMANIVGNDTSNDKMRWLIKKLVHGHAKHAVWSQCMNRHTQMTSEVKTEITIGFGTVKLVELDTLNSSQRPFWNLACWHACQESHMTCYKFAWLLGLSGMHKCAQKDQVMY